MKILVVPSWYPPQGGRFFRLQSESLAKLGHEVDVLILEEKGITQKINPKIDASKSKQVNEIRDSYLRIPKLNKLNIRLFIKKYRNFLLNYLKENKPDVIHVHSVIWAGVVVSKIAKDKNIPYVITEHRSLFFNKKLPFDESSINEIKYAFDHSSNIVSVSSEMCKVINQYTRQKISIIPNMVNTNFFKLNEKRKKQESFTFLSIGNLIPVKGFDILIDAFAEIYKENNNVQLKIIGVGKELENLMKQTKKLNIESSVKFCGYKTRDELRKMFQEVSVLVSSSRKEAFGVVIAEALCSGLPIVVTKSGGPENIVNDSNGYLAENENANSLQSKMQLMIDNIDNFDGEKISQDALNIYSEKAVSESLEKLLKNVAKIN